MTRPVSLLFAPLMIAISFILLANKVGCEVYTSLQWSPENPMFMTNTTRCPDGEFPQMKVMSTAQINVICPTPAIVLKTVQSTKPKQNSIENLWITYDKESFETCNVNTTRNRQLIQCNDPLGLKYFTIVFQQVSPERGGLEFTPGEEYYFLATSDGTVESLNNSAGGHCNDTENGVSMRFKVYVCKDENDPKCADETAETMGKLNCNSIPTPGVPSTTHSSTGGTATSSSSTTSGILTSSTDVATKSPRKEPRTGDCTKDNIWMILFIVAVIIVVLQLLGAIYHYRKHMCTQRRASTPQDAEHGLTTNSVCNDAYRYSTDLNDGKFEEPQGKKTNVENPLNNLPKPRPQDKAPDRVSLKERRSNNNITNELSTNDML